MGALRRIGLVASLVLAICLAASPAHAVRAQITPGQCVDGTLPSGALSMICIPSSGWNGDLVLWAHGYTAYNQPLDFQNLNFDGVYLPTLVQNLGYAFATTSYRKNGLAILEGVDDMVQLVNAFTSTVGHPAGHTYLTGASEGGIVTALSLERHPELYSGGLAACGPIGDFQKQLDYWGDYRTLFNYFFPNVIPQIPGDPVHIPQTVIDNWDNQYQPAVQSAVSTNPTLTQQLIRTGKASIDPANPATTAVSTTLDLMWYNVFATNDGIQELGGNPYDNLHRWYSGSSNDLRLNLSVTRIAADPAAINAVNSYQTSGNLTRPLVTLHTTGDDVIPFWNELLYKAKAHPTGTGSLTQLTVPAYGHCNFTVNQVLGAFAILVSKVTGTTAAGLALPDVRNGYLPALAGRRCASVWIS